MIHYSCDRCKRLIETDDELRYVVRFEVEASFGDEDVGGDLEHLFENDELLDETSPPESLNDRQRFDLCGECYAAFRSNPLGQENPKPVGFSEN